MDKPGLLARFVLFVGIIGLAALPVGALGHRFGLWGMQTGFAVVFSSVVLAVIVLVLGIATLVFAKTRRRPVDRLPAFIGLAASVVVLIPMGIQHYKAVTVPVTTDISTDRDDPPRFDRLGTPLADGANASEYTADEAALQAHGYPDLAGIETPLAPDESFAHAIATARSLGWEVVEDDADAGLIEATDSTFWFGFTDDVVIRIRDNGSGSVVDLRSASRIGLSDLGTNAKRIRSFIERWAETP